MKDLLLHRPLPVMIFIVSRNLAKLLDPGTSLNLTNALIIGRFKLYKELFLISYQYNEKKLITFFFLKNTLSCWIFLFTTCNRMITLFWWCTFPLLNICPCGLFFFTFFFLLGDGIVST